MLFIALLKRNSSLDYGLPNKTKIKVKRKEQKFRQLELITKTRTMIKCFTMIPFSLQFSLLNFQCSTEYKNGGFEGTFDGNKYLHIYIRHIYATSSGSTNPRHYDIGKFVYFLLIRFILIHAYVNR